MKHKKTDWKLKTVVPVAHNEVDPPEEHEVTALSSTCAQVGPYTVRLLTGRSTEERRYKTPSGYALIPASTTAWPSWDAYREDMLRRRLKLRVLRYLNHASDSQTVSSKELRAIMGILRIPEEP